MKLNSSLSLEENVKNNLKEKRYIHVLSVAKLSKKIAAFYHLDEEKAYVAGLLHDIAKGLCHEEQEEMIKEHFPELIDMPKYAYHAYDSAYIAKNEFHFEDETIYKAIFNHCRPVKNMGKIEKIVYLSDKIEETRPFADSTAYLRELAFKDLDLCFIKTMEDQISYFKEGNPDEIDKNTFEMLDYYKEEYKNGR